jgi:RNA polymerase-binding transcription factor DksA
MKDKKKIVKKETKEKGPAFVFPMSLLNPIGHFLSARLHELNKRKKEVEKDDPFKDKDRLLDNASPDSDAAEQFGHEKTNAIKHELENKIKQTKNALGRLRKGKYGLCEDCGKIIDTERLSVYPEATVCTACQAKREK